MLTAIAWQALEKYARFAGSPIIVLVGISKYLVLCRVEEGILILAYD